MEVEARAFQLRRPGLVVKALRQAAREKRREANQRGKAAPPRDVRMRLRERAAKMEDEAALIEAQLLD